MIEIGVLCRFRTVRREQQKQGSVFLLLFLSDLQSREAMVLCGVFCVFSSAKYVHTAVFFVLSSLSCCLVANVPQTPREQEKRSAAFLFFFVSKDVYGTLVFFLASETWRAGGEE